MQVTTMRFKRLHLFFLIGFIFFLWNFVTFYSLANGNKPMIFGKDEHLKEKELAGKLDHLQQEMKKQMEENKNLLETLLKLKKKKEEEQHNAQKDLGVIEAPIKQPQPDIKPNVQKIQPAANEKSELEIALEASPEEHIPSGDKHDILPILMIACDRVTVRRALDKLLVHRPSATRFPIIVSQDCGHAETAKVIQEFVRSHNVTHIKHPDLSNISLPKPQKKFVGYYKIARHYKWALNQVFITFNFSAVIIVEDDLDISPDFYEYFSATLPILRKDPTLWCVSAWNDNGKVGMVSNEAELLYRTDFFPGLGWMIERKLWMELKPQWPETFWDDWMRHPETRKGRECIRPEICRTSTFGKKGVSKGLFFEKHLKFIKLNEKYVSFSKMDLSYLEKANYDEMFTKKVYSAPLMSGIDVKRGVSPNEQVVRVEYTDKKSFKAAAKLLGIMDDFKAGVPRAAYRGVTSFMLKDRRIFLAPPSTWKGYDTSWS